MASSDQCIVDGRTLNLNGTGYRRLFMVNVYKACLYTETKISSERELYEFSAPVRLHFEYLYGPISRDRIAGAWEDALRRVAHGDISMPLETFLLTITDYQKGDMVDYDILPNEELRIRKNGKEAAVIRSRQFCCAVLDVVFGPEPIDKKLKDGLLSEAAVQVA